MYLIVKRVIVIIIVLWMVVVSVVVLLLIIRKLVFNFLFGENVEFCVEIWLFKYVKVYKMFILVIFYVMLFVFMVLVYYKIGRKVWVSVDKM